MRFDKKVMECGAVLSFAFVMTVSTVCGKGMKTQTNPGGQAVELTVEPTEYYDTSLIAMALSGRIAADGERVPDSEETPLAKAVMTEKALKPEEVAEKTAEPEQEEGQEAAASSEAKQEEIKPSQEILEEEAEDEEPEALKEEPEASKEGPAASQEVAMVSQEELKEQEEAGVTEESVKAEQPEASDAEIPEDQTIEVDLPEKGNEEVSPWASKLLPNVEEYLNIRTEASDDAELAGKLRKGDSAVIVEKGDTWTKISSGNVEGYVKNEFCVTGLEAEELAQQVGTTYAVATTGGVRVREEASSAEETGILDVMEEGGKLVVDTQAEGADGWVAVKTEEGVGYVSEEFIDVELKLGRAISIEEERAQIAAEEAEQARKAQQESSAGSTGSAGVTQNAAVAASYDDVTLLGALIQCEAGGEPYEGKLAVGAVVMNRLRAGYAGSISGVIYQSGQFTPASNGMLAGVLASGVNGSCLQAAQQAIGGASNVGGATSFRRASAGAAGIVIGNHVFF